MEELIESNHNNYVQHIVTPITSYLLCDHYFSTEIYENLNHKYIEFDLIQLLGKNKNDLYKNGNINTIKEGDIIQVQVDLFYTFIKHILPHISCKVVVITSQFHLPQIHKHSLTDELLNNDKIILWISQNPIYANHKKYMAFPYGIYHQDVNAYMNFVKKNRNCISNIDTKTNLCYNSPVSLTSKIRNNPIFNNKNSRVPYEDYLNNILKSKFTISPSGDRDDCYRHYECIGLNSIPISNINYTEIFENEMIYSNIDDIGKIINGIKNDMIFHETNKDILTIDYWKEKMLFRIHELKHT